MARPLHMSTQRTESEMPPPSNNETAQNTLKAAASVTGWSNDNPTPRGIKEGGSNIIPEQRVSDSEAAHLNLYTAPCHWASKPTSIPHGTLTRAAPMIIRNPKGNWINPKTWDKEFMSS